MYLDALEYDLLRRWCQPYKRYVGLNTTNFKNKINNLPSKKLKLKYKFRNSLNHRETNQAIINFLAI